MIERPYPRGARWLVCLYLVGLTLALVAGAALAVVMRFELWDVEATLAEDTYNRVFTLHGSIMAFGVMVPGLLVLCNLVVSSALRPARSPTLPLAFAGLLAWTVSIALIVYTLLAAAPSLEAFASASMALMAASLVLTLVHLLAALGAGRLTPAGRLAVGGAIGAIAWLCVWWLPALYGNLALIDVSMAVLSHAPTMCLVAACSALPYLIERVAGSWPGSASRAGVAIVIAVIPRLGFAHWAPISAGLLALSYFALSILRAAVISRARSTGPMLLVAFAVVPALLLFSLLSTFLSSIAPDLPVHDTYVAVANFHLFGATFVVALLVAVQAFWDELAARAYAPRLARVSAALLGTGICLTSIAMVVAGSRGQARRYHQYDESFETLNRIIGVGALVAILGGVVAVAALFAGGRALRTSREDATAQVFE